MQNGADSSYLSYVYNKVKQRFAFLPADCKFQKEQDGAQIEFKTQKEYCPYVRRFMQEMIADVLSVGYKYRFFQRYVRVPLLTQRQKQWLFTALISADYKEDKAYVLEKIEGLESYCLDGVYHFCLQNLKERWFSVAKYVPTDMGVVAVDEFIRFLVEDGEGKIFIKNGKVYDEDYRVISKSILTGEQSLIGEILLCGAEKIYCFGEPGKETVSFLKKYYREKAVFC